jgi:hypothetical protein
MARFYSGGVQTAGSDQRQGLLIFNVIWNLGLFLSFLSRQPF